MQGVLHRQGAEEGVGDGDPLCARVSHPIAYDSGGGPESKCPRRREFKLPSRAQYALVLDNWWGGDRLPTLG